MVKDINAEEYEQIKDSKNTVVIDFHATWCGPCKILSPILEELQGEMNDVKFVKLDVDQFPFCLLAFSIRVDLRIIDSKSVI